jgi:hypothetical protein
VWLCPALLLYFSEPPETIHCVSFASVYAPSAESHWTRPASP